MEGNLLRSPWLLYVSKSYKRRMEVFGDGEHGGVTCIAGYMNCTKDLGEEEEEFVIVFFLFCKDHEERVRQDHRRVHCGLRTTPMREERTRYETRDRECIVVLQHLILLSF